MVAVVQGKDAVRVSARRVGVVALLSACLVLVGCASAKTTSGVESQTSASGTSSPSQGASSSQATFQWVVDAEGGKFTGDLAQDNGLTLTLTGVPDHVTRFADRPLRAATVVATADFTRRWPKWFADSSPNAVLSYLVPGTTRPQSIVVTLDTPVYDAAAGTMTYPATRLHRTLDMAADAQGNVTPVTIETPKTFSSASLFIDSAGGGVPVNGSATAAEDPCFKVPYPQYGCEGKDFTGQDLSQVSGFQVNLVRSKLSGAKMGRFVDSHFEGTTAVGTDFSAGRQLVCGKLSVANLQRAKFDGMKLQSISFGGSDLTDASLRNVTGLLQLPRGSDPACTEPAMLGTKLVRTDLTGVDLTGVSMGGADLTEANLTNANVSEAEVTVAQLSKAHLCNTKMPNGQIDGNRDCGKPWPPTR